MNKSTERCYLSLQRLPKVLWRSYKLFNTHQKKRKKNPHLGFSLVYGYDLCSWAKRSLWGENVSLFNGMRETGNLCCYPCWHILFMETYIRPRTCGKLNCSQDARGPVTEGELWVKNKNSVFFSFPTSGCNYNVWLTSTSSVQGDNIQEYTDSFRCLWERCLIGNYKGTQVKVKTEFEVCLCEPDCSSKKGMCAISSLRGSCLNHSLTRLCHHISKTRDFDRIR